MKKILLDYTLEHSIILIPLNVKKGRNEANDEFGIKNQFVIDNRVVTVYPSAMANRPVVYLNTFAELISVW